MRTTLKYLPLLLLCTTAARTTAAEKPDTLKRGGHTYVIREKTPEGTLVVPMWEAKMPTADQAKAVGFPVLKEASHFDVWKPADLASGSYNHYACLIFHGGLFYAMWANHPLGEGCPGQRILFSTSKDAKSWSPPAVLFSPPGPVLAKGESGMNITPDRWVEVDGKLYAVVYVHGEGFGRYPITCRLAQNGTVLYDAVLLSELGEGTPLPAFMPEPLIDPALGTGIRQWYQDKGAISWWASSDSRSMISWWAQPDVKNISSQAIDKANLIEMFSYRSDHGVVAFARDYSSQATKGARKSSNRVYVIFENPRGGWYAARPTNIPDSHSRGEAVRLDDGRVLLVGNQTAQAFDKGLYRTRDPLTLAVSPDGEVFTRAYALRSAGDTPLKRRFPGLPGCGPAGYGYPSMIVQDGTVYVLYSINKEDIAVSIVPLASLE